MTPKQSRLYSFVQGEPFRPTFIPSAAAFHPPPYTRNRTNNRVYKVPQREEKRVQVRERDPPARQLAPAF